MISPVLPTINVLYENPVWIPPLREALESEGFRVRLVHVNEGIVDPSAPPPEGIWMNRISPSSHTRGHVHTVELARQLLYLAGVPRPSSHQRAGRLRAGDEQASPGPRPAATRNQDAAHGAGRREGASARSGRNLRRPVHHQARSGGQGPGHPALPATPGSSKSILTTGASTPGPAPG